ncbi:hypothetical protein QBC43DRAFT_127319 [Cladorrhinum sp. PSN259]|nr:hypothetical protein QBC43DRAFT_127319 [Cladorrhinum sp. PSN259]
MTLVTTTMTDGAQPGGTLTTSAPSHSCPQCGFDLSLNSSFEETQLSLLAAQKQIADLQEQVKLLNEKATAAVDRWADYEDELSRLRAQLLSSKSQEPVMNPASSSPSRPKTAPNQQHLGTPPPPPAGANRHHHHPTPPSSVIATPSPSRTSFLASMATTSAATRISALLSSRKSTPNLKPLPTIPSQQSTATTTTTTSQQQQQLRGAPPSPIPSLPSSYSPFFSPPPSISSSTFLSTEDLLSALSKEQARRLEVESRLSETSKEVEELSVSLFEQANEMVASERRARAKLEERVGELERRDVEKRRRLEVLERGVGRIERVRGVLLDEKSGR